MSNWDDYKPVVSSSAVTGKRRCLLVDAKDTISKSSGLPMWEFTVIPNGSKAKVKTYIVKNERFNENMTRFFDSFGIERGDFNSAGWIYAMGAADFDVDENGYTKVKWFLSPKQAENLPPWDGLVPERQTVTEIGFEICEDDLDLPFSDDESNLP